MDWLGLELRGACRANTRAAPSQIALQLPDRDPVIHAAAAHAQLTGNRGFGQTLVQQVFESHQSLPSVHRRLHEQGETQRGGGAGKPATRPRRAAECAISTGDSVQSQTGDDNIGLAERRIELPQGFAVAKSGLVLPAPLTTIAPHRILARGRLKVPSTVCHGGVVGRPARLTVTCGGERRPPDWATESWSGAEARHLHAADSLLQLHRAEP